MPRPPALRRLPDLAETMINEELAADGIDELLRGFLPRPMSSLRTESPYVIEIQATDADQRWQVAVSEQSPQSVRGTTSPSDAVISGSGARAVLGTVESR